MRLVPLRQEGPFDVATWAPDAQFAVFPVGARAKEAFFAPDDIGGVIKPGRRYLFKRSKKSYPDQFWGEVIAYRVGCLLGVKVPPAFYAFNSDTHVAGALIEWFYDPTELYVPGGDYLVRLQPDYEREVGEQHNLEHIRALLQALTQRKRLEEDWRLWWVDALLFDALIGNTDRHQDNWGIVFGIPKAPGELRPARLSPLFDNGTSLGHERFPDRIADWQQKDYDRYVSKGTHHVKWRLDDPVDSHVGLLTKAIEAWPHTREIARARLHQTSADEVAGCFTDLLQLPGPNPLTQQRFDFIVRLLKTRFQKLTELL